ncbi:helix-turn-helix domain-containing protein [Peribacillus kribbensis]|uniref:helix-turn-helix domain-containing protein n=1 Tax=Peribacillus kribbensis TaxID=356658 RepID=UPI000410191E|nr:helix-turn-helix domain-containing protein [Peribacillus kribbensis]
MESGKQLVSLINAARVLTSTLDLNKVLNQLIHEVLNVIDGAHAGILFIYHEKRKKLVITEGVGFDLDYLKQIELELEEGMTGRTFSTKKAQIFRHVHETTEAMNNIKPNNLELFHKALGETHYFPMSTISAPLLSKDGCIGVLTIDSFSDKVIFTSQDLLILESFAAQASIAIENAKLFAQQERSKKIHAELAKASVFKNDLSQITTTLARLIQRDVFLFNEFLDSIVSSNPEGNKQANESVKKYSGVFQQPAHNQPLSYETLEEEGFRLFPIKTDKFTIGILAVRESDEEFDALDDLAIELASNLFALELLGQERALSELSKYEGYLLEQLLNDKLDAFTAPQRKIAGISGHNRYLCVHITISNERLPFQEFNSRKQYFNRMLNHELQTLSYKVLVQDKNLEYVLLLIVDDQKGEEEILKAMTAFFSRLYRKIRETTSFVYHVGLGRVFHALTDIQSSYRDALRCTEYGKLNRMEDNVLSYKTLGMYRLFLKSDPIDLQDYVEDRIGKLIAYDAEHNTELVQTLTTYLESNQNMTLTAAKSYVHINTIKYRLSKMKKLLAPYELEGKGAFDIQLALYLREYIHYL